jgi:acetolactate synthase-1/2/3 large subunit
MLGIDKLVGFLSESQRPLILMGQGARRTSSDIIAFAERFDIPIETTWPAMDLIEWEHGLFIGRPGIVATRAANTTLQECDLLISIGARLDPSTIAFRYDKLAPKAKKVLVDVDPSEALKIPNLDLFVEGDASHFIEEVSHKVSSVSQMSHKWLETCQELKAQHRMESDTASYQLCNALGDALTSDDVLVLGCSTMAVAIFCAFFKNKKGQRIILSSCGLGSMGSAIPVAIGASLASGKKVVCIEGDGSFFQNVQELEVVNRFKLDITFFVINNGGYASIRNSEERAFGRHAEGMTFPDVCKVASAFGIKSTKTSSPKIAGEVWKSGGNLVELIVPKDEVLIPRVNAMDVGGGLSNMYPYLEEK